jgi:hypothetical protein
MFHSSNKTAASVSAMVHPNGEALLLETPGVVLIVVVVLYDLVIVATAVVVDSTIRLPVMNGLSKYGCT